MHAAHAALLYYIILCMLDAVEIGIIPVDVLVYIEILTMKTQHIEMFRRNFQTCPCIEKTA